MSRPIVPFSQLDVPQLLTLHNTLAQQCGEPTKKSWHQSRTDLVMRVAILRTLPAKKQIAVAFKRPRRQPIREVMMKHLAVVSHYECGKTGKKLSRQAAARRQRSEVISVGLAYPEVLRRIRRELPDARTTGGTLRVACWATRNGEPGFEDFKLPQKRPHNSTEQVT